MASLPRNIHTFAVWCTATHKLQPSSTRAYISSLKLVHTLRGLPADDLLSDPISQTILRGAGHHQAISDPPTISRVVDFPLLTLCSHITLSQLHPISKQVIWTACTTGFFSSARLAELLASKENN